MDELIEVELQEVVEVGGGGSSDIAWLPSVDESGDLSWTRSATTTPPETVNIKGSPGADGQDGAPGRDGIDGKDGKDGQDGAPGRDGIDGKDGKDGQDGAPGADGKGIASIVKTSTSGNVDTYTITYTDGTTQTYTVTNGTNGSDGKDGKDGVDGKDGSDYILTSQDKTDIANIVLGELVVAESQEV